MQIIEVPIKSWADKFIVAFMPDVIHYPTHVFEKNEFVQNSLKLTSVWNGIGNKHKGLSQMGVVLFIFADLRHGFYTIVSNEGFLFKIALFEACPTPKAEK
jgi:hypothetical protein